MLCMKILKINLIAFLLLLLINTNICCCAQDAKDIQLSKIENSIWGFEYSKDDIKAIGQFIEPKRDNNFDYAGLYSLSERYLSKDFDGSILELPQERFLIIAMHLMIEETSDRLSKIKDLYDALSKMYLTVATPTMMNAGKVSGGLSSCHVLTTEDSLRGIYDDNTDVATFSKNGAGIGKLPA